MSDHGTAAQGQAGDGVLRRLLGARMAAQEQAGMAPQLPQPAPPTPARAAATAVGRVADRLYGIATQPVTIAPGALSLAEMPELLPDPALMAVLEGAGEALGVMALSPELVTTLVEVQALGRLTARTPERRRPTRSEAMLCADFVNALLAELAQELAGVEGFEAWAGYRYASYLDDIRPLLLMLEDQPFRSLDMTLRLGGPEGREARIFIALPQPALYSRPKPTPAVETAPETAPEPAAMPMQPDLRPSLAGSVAEAPVELVGILCRRLVSLSELRGLVPGKTLPLPRVSLTEARIETPTGQLLARGQLGEAEGCHAIRLHDPQAIAAPPEQALARNHVSPAPMDDLDRPDPFRDAASPSDSGLSNPA